MAGITSCLPDSFRKELMTAKHNFLASGGDTFKVGLFKATVGRTYDKSTTNLSEIQASTTDEVANGSGYTTGGVTCASVDPTASSNIAFTDLADATWTSATFTSDGTFCYNSAQSNKIVFLFVFSVAGQSVTAGTFSVVMPAAASGTAIIRIA